MCIKLAVLKIALSNVSGDASVLALMVTLATVGSTWRATKPRNLEGHLQTSLPLTKRESVSLLG